MGIIDIAIIGVYIVVMLLIGLRFFLKNNSTEDYFVGGRKMTRWHLGLSVVATDVGGGFSIGLGGLGFTMGLSGSWLLFTGLIGAWLTAAILIPRVYSLAKIKKFQTFPELLNHHYGYKVAFFAGIISAIGYLGFTSSQILAGAKLASATFNGVSINQAVLFMGIVAIVYTVLGGLKAVIYTDTIQWIILLSGLLFVGLPVSWFAVGGWDAIVSTLSKDMLSLTNIGWTTFVNWLFTIIPIWFIGMTLYQRIYAANSEKEARKAWYVAGIFEYPVMAFLGVTLGMLAKVALINGALPSVADPSAIDAEVAMPLMLRYLLPTGALGIILAAYFSAILSTADSCLMASSGNITRDILGLKDSKRSLKAAQLFTLFVGITALVIAIYMPSVLELMLLSYSFMVCGLFVPVLGIIYSKQHSNGAALASMITGVLTLGAFHISGVQLPFKIDPVIPGILFSALVYIALNTKKKSEK